MRVRELFEHRSLIEQPLIDAIKKHAPKNAELISERKVPALWRGMNVHGNDVMIGSEAKMAVMRPPVSMRNSQTGNNLFISYVSQSPEWNATGVNRGTSTSCSLRFSTSENFSNEHWLVIPFDNVNLYCSTPEDFNYKKVGGKRIFTTQSHIINVIESIHRWGADKDINPELRKLCSNPILSHSISSKTFSIQEIKDFSDAIEKIIYYFDDNDWADKQDTETKADAIFSAVDDLEFALETRSIYEWMKENLDPESFGVETHSSLLELDAIPKASEVWFNGQYILVGSSDDEFTKHLPGSTWLRDVVGKATGR